MSLQFYFGPSGSGKSRQLHMDMLALAEKNPEKNILFLVPDQFTMQTQFDLVNASKVKGIRNIDVLSFGRLSHRIFEETGYGTKPVLDDTGKSLVLRKVAAQITEALPVIGANLNKIGYIHEVKSAISEFMQYGMNPDAVAELAEYAKGHGALYDKLKDLQLIYQAFLSYIEDEFITTEETLELLTRAVEKSEIVKNSVVIFDGFTGFTPIQNRLIQRLMQLADTVIISVLIDGKENPFGQAGEQELFYLSKKTVTDLCKLAEEAGVGRKEDVFLRTEPVARFAGNMQLAHLEKQLFRYPLRVYRKKADEADAVCITEAYNPAQEAREVCRRIKELVLSEDYCYRDIAIIAGDLEVYGEYLKREADVFEIPMFIDKTRGLLLNPFIEFIRSSLKIRLTNFSYESVFHYLRSGLADFEEEEIDRLENYALSLGLKGKKKWSEAFVRKPWVMEEEKQLLLLDRLNQSREKLMEQLSPLLVKQQTAGDYVRALYDFIVNAKIQEKLGSYESFFDETGDREKAREYAQIYRLVMELLEQIDSLLGKEELSLQEFADILDAGFAEIEIGIIPGSIDRVVAGDMERTRLKQVKILFVLGVNDGNIPKGSSKGGILSDIDREYLKESDFELAPTPRQQMYIQRLYLYMNLTKPSEKLFLSYAKVSSEGKSLRPSYLIDMIRRLFPEIQTKYAEAEENIVGKITGVKDGLTFVSEKLRTYAERPGEEENAGTLAALLSLYGKEPKYAPLVQKMTEAAFMSYRHSPLSSIVAKSIYGTMLENSVSRLEKFAGCAYAHFLQYGLKLKEREEYGFEQVDLGNIYHNVLELFAGKLADCNYTWFDFPKEEGERLLREALESCAAQYGETVLYSNARYSYMVERFYRILCRTIHTLQKQLKGGLFVPAHFEMSFSKVENLESVNIALTGQEKMKLRGRIDRIDTYEDADHVYVKVIDYKSGNKKFDLAALYYGLQLQLVVYMNVASEHERKKNPDKEIVPAALLYYHVNDPMVKEEKELSPEEINERLQKELRMTGVVSDKPEVIGLLDKEFSDKSLIVPVERKKDGSFSASSSVISKEDYQVVSEFVNRKIKETGKAILEGNIAINPCEQGNYQACTYCDYKAVCGFDEKIPGYECRVLPTLPDDELLAKMREEI